MLSVARVYTLLLFAGFGILFGTLTLPTHIHPDDSVPVLVRVWYNSETQAFNEFVVRLFGYGCLGIVAAMLTGSYPAGIIVAEVLCGIAFFLRYRYGVEQGFPDRMNHAMLVWAAIAAIDIGVNSLVLLRSARLRRFVRLFDMLGSISVGLAGYFLFPIVGQHIMPPDVVSWFVKEGRTIVSFNFQLVCAATLLLGLFALFDSTRNPLPFAVTLFLMAAVMAFKFAALQSSAALSAWQSPTVPAVYLGLTLVGALLNLLEWWQITRAAPQMRRKYQ